MAKGTIRRPTEDQALARCKNVVGGDPDIREVMDRNGSTYKIWVSHHHKDDELANLYFEWLSVKRGTVINSFLRFLWFYGIIYRDTQIQGPK